MKKAADKQAAPVAIRVDSVSKVFKLPHEKNSSLKTLLINFRKRRTYEQQQALEDVSFEVKQGEFFGIVGRNGSGKSTLLKMLAGIYTPTAGSITINGSLTPFIELGVGFNPELTGRENVFLNGALLGFSRTDMRDIYKEIVEFAELENFMDQKLKNYSSGMQVRLAFSIAIRAKSDILLIDEVLAVGDEAFQRKCIKVFDDYKKSKRTVVIVTHDMQTVRKYCTRAMLIDEGKIVALGSPQETATRYSKLNQVGDNSQKYSAASSQMQLEIMNRPSRGQNGFAYGSKLSVRLSWSPTRPVDAVGVAIYSSVGEYIFAANTSLDKVSLAGVSQVLYEVDLKLGAGNYFLMGGTFKGKDNQVVDFISDGPGFTMDKETKIKGEGLFRLEHAWHQDK